MRRIMNGLTYDTETAVHLCDLACGEERGNYRWHETSLYRTCGGAFFLAGIGNALSMWRQRADGGFTNGEGIRPVTPEEALRILEAENAIEAIEELFGEMPEAGDATAVMITLPAELHDRAETAAKASGETLGAFIRRCIEAAAGIPAA